MNSRLAVTFSLIAALALAALLFDSRRAPNASAEPCAQATAPAPTPTEEPTKPPYVFPTPIFIPTYPGETLPPTRTPTPTRTPVATPTPLGTPMPGERTYTVVSGDSPWKIAQKIYGDGTKYPLIMSANNLTAATRLRVGIVLRIPPLTPIAQLAPTLTRAPVLASPTPQPTAAPTATPSVSPTPIAQPTPAAGDALLATLNVLSAIFFIASVVCAALAFLIIRRAQRLGEIAMRPRRLRIR